MSDEESLELDDVCALGDADVVRHPPVQASLRADDRGACVKGKERA